MEEIWMPIWLSVKVAVTSTIIVLGVGVFIAALLDKRSFKGKTIIESLILVPMVLPPTVVGFGLVYLFGKNGPMGSWLESVFNIHVYFSWLGAVAAAVIVSMPLMYQSAKTAFSQVDARYQNAAKTMGAGEWKVFRTVTIPLAWPGLLSGVVLSFARGLGEFGATLMIAGYIPGETDTLPLAVYFAVEAGEMERAVVWVIILFAFGLIAVTWLNRLNENFKLKLKGR